MPHVKVKTIFYLGFPNSMSMHSYMLFRLHDMSIILNIQNFIPLNASIMNVRIWSKYSSSTKKFWRYPFLISVFVSIAQICIAVKIILVPCIFESRYNLNYSHLWFYGEWPIGAMIDPRHGTSNYSGRNLLKDGHY